MNLLLKITFSLLVLTSTIEITKSRSLREIVEYHDDEADVLEEFPYADLPHSPMAPVKKESPFAIKKYTAINISDILQTLYDHIVSKHHDTYLPDVHEESEALLQRHGGNVFRAVKHALSHKRKGLTREQNLVWSYNLAALSSMTRPTYTTYQVLLGQLRDAVLVASLCGHDVRKDRRIKSRIMLSLIGANASQVPFPRNFFFHLAISTFFSLCKTSLKGLHFEKWLY